MACAAVSRTPAFPPSSPDLVRALVSVPATCALWISRGFLLGTIIVAWRAWAWTGVAAVVAFSVLWMLAWWCFYNILDALIPRPTHRTSLARIDRALRSKDCPVPQQIAHLLLVAVDEVHRDLNQGKSFMEATFGRVVDRDVARLTEIVSRTKSNSATSDDNITCR